MQHSVYIANREAWLWFVLAAIVVFMGGAAAAIKREHIETTVVITLGLASVPVAVGLLVKRGIELGDEIVVRYLRRSKTVAWREVAFFNHEQRERKLPTGVPFFPTPLGTSHSLHFRLRSGKTLKMAVAEQSLEQAKSIIGEKVNPDQAGEYRRRLAAQASNAKFDRWFIVVMASVTAIGGVSFLVLTLPDVIHGYQSEHWPVTTGRVVSTSVTSKRKDDSVSYALGVKYTYNVDKRNLTGDRWKFGPPGTRDQEQANAFRDIYRKDAEVSVHYHPSNPRLSALVPGAHSSRVFLAAAASAALLSGLYFLVISLRKLRSDPMNAS